MAKEKSYVPSRGDLIWLNFAPHSGIEQEGVRPAIVLSDKTFNRTVGLAICCPVTSTVRGGPFEVPLPKKLGISGVVLSDQVRSVDWEARTARLIASAPKQIVAEVVDKLSAIIGIFD
jgi:mRNA interferase MazF